MSAKSQDNLQTTQVPANAQESSNLPASANGHSGANPNWLIIGLVTIGVFVLFRRPMLAVLAGGGAYVLTSGIIGSTVPTTSSPTLPSTPTIPATPQVYFIIAPSA